MDDPFARPVADPLSTTSFNPPNGPDIAGISAAIPARVDQTRVRIESVDEPPPAGWKLERAAVADEMPYLRGGIQVAQPTHETPLQVSSVETREIKCTSKDSEAIAASATAAAHNAPGCA